MKYHNNEYTIVTEPPLGYEIWNIKDAPNGCLPFCGAFLENEAPSTIWCHPRNSCLLSLRGIVGADQIVQWDTRYGEMTGKDNAIGEK